MYVFITNVVNNVGEEAECEEVEVIPYSKCISDVMAARAADRWRKPDIGDTVVKMGGVLGAHQHCAWPASLAQILTPLVSCRALHNHANVTTCVRSYNLRLVLPACFLVCLFVSGSRRAVDGQTNRRELTSSLATANGSKLTNGNEDMFKEKCVTSALWPRRSIVPLFTYLETLRTFQEV